MIKYFLKRLLMIIPVMLGVVIIVFTLLYITPGDPATMMLSEQATQEDIEALREQLGLNDPYFVRLGNYILGIFKGSLGVSYISRQDVFTHILYRFPYTLKLAVASTIISIVLGLLLGIISAIKPYSVFDNVAMTFALVGVSMPNFWEGLLLMLLFSVKLGWLPATGLDSFKALILPAVTVGTSSMAIIARMTRSSMLEVVNADYITTARAKGQSEWKVIMRHALRNALIPIITTVGLQFGGMLSGAVVTETVFAIPGLGKWVVDSIKSRDYPAVQGGVLFMALTFSLVNLLVDMLYAFVDPRIKARYR